MATGNVERGVAARADRGEEPRQSSIREPRARDVGMALAAALAFVMATRLPVARPAPYDLDELGYLDFIATYRLPPTHTLFLAIGRVLGLWVGDAYRGFLALDMLVSALTLTASWWWLRALVRPATAVAATLVLGLSPIVWAYGAMAANYTAILLVGSILLGIAWRSHRAPRAWHPYAAAVALALGAGYRQDIGTLWLPVFGLVLWRYRWGHAVQASALFVLVNFAWFLPMLHDIGGWSVYRALNREFAHKAGYLNSVWHLGWIDGPVRYAAKLAIALGLTLGPGLLVIPRGLARLRQVDGGGFLALLLAVSAAPALGLHLLVHFGVPGYGLHYVPALIALIALGIGRVPMESGAIREGPSDTRRVGTAHQFSWSSCRRWWAVPTLRRRIGLGIGRVSGNSGSTPVTTSCDRAPARLVLLGTLLAAFFLLYPTDYRRGGLRGDFDLAFARYTRVGLNTEPPLRVPSSWRTMNSEVLPGGERTSRPRRSIAEVVSSLGASGTR